MDPSYLFEWSSSDVKRWPRHTETLSHAVSPEFRHRVKKEHAFMFSSPLEGDYVQGCGCVGERAASRHPRCECGPAQGQRSSRKG